MTDAIAILVITGQTASGKEGLAVAVAAALGGEIVSADSMKVYRGMDIGTAKPSADQRRAVPHHLLDVADPGETFSTALWARMADLALADIHARGRTPVVSGGTPLYLKALLEGMFEGPAADQGVRDRLRAEAEARGTGELHERLMKIDPAAAARIHRNDLRRIVRALEIWELTGTPISELQRQWGSRRPRYRPLVVAIRRDREDLTRRIRDRVRRMMEAGLVDEVRRLAARPGLPRRGPLAGQRATASPVHSPASPVRSTEGVARPGACGGPAAGESGGLARGPRQAVGYAEVIELLEGRATRDETVAAIIAHTRQFARRQMTWLSRFEGVVWLDVAPSAAAESLAGQVAELWRGHVAAQQ